MVSIYSNNMSYYLILIYCFLKVLSYSSRDVTILITVMSHNIMFEVHQSSHLI